MNVVKENILRTIARYRVMCPAIPLMDILQAMGISEPDRYMNIERSPLYVEVVKEMRSKLEDSILEQGSIDPVLVTLKIASQKAALRLAEEVDNLNKESEGATASTRIIAANSILNMMGYGGKMKDSTVVNITISEKQAASIVKVETPLQEQPSKVGIEDL